MGGTVTGRSLIERSLISGLVGATTTTIALAVMAVREGKGAAQPLNATSHWLNGDSAALRSRVDVRHTGVGLGTHIAATVFWAAFFEAWLAARPAQDRLAAKAAAIAILAATVDYTITPKRFTPGWELVMSKSAMAVAYTAMAGGFAASALLRSTT